ncbi:MAG: hypothetical protein JWM02_2165 [Frankiales bacterium]|nr:hypothetical protein [Frankiales bacterium]
MKTPHNLHRPRCAVVCMLLAAACATQTAERAVVATDSNTPDPAHRILQIGEAGAYTWFIDEDGLSVSRDRGQTADPQSLPFKPAAAVVEPAGAGLVAGLGAAAQTVAIATAAEVQSGWRTASFQLPFEASAVTVVRTAKVAVVLVRRATGSGVSIGRSLISVDGGASWKQADAPAYGELTAAGADIYLLPSAAPDAVFRLADGGWEREPLPAHPGRDVRYGHPIGQGANLLLPAVDVTEGPELRWLAPTPTGWQPTGSPLALSPKGQTVPPTVRTDDGALRVLLNDGESISVVTSTDDANSYRTAPADGLAGAPIELAAGSDGSLTTLLDTTSCSGGKSQCTGATMAFSSEDGGATWNRWR